MKNGLLKNRPLSLKDLSKLRHLVIKIIVYKKQTRTTNPEQTAQIHFRESKDGDIGLVRFDGEERVTKKQKELLGMMNILII